MLDLSIHGACVAFSPGTEIPRLFDLQIGTDKRTLAARVIWRRSHTVGVGFAEPRVAPDVFVD